MIRYSLAVLATFLLLLPVSVFAAGYGAAGCGLGSMEMGSDSGFSPVFCFPDQWNIRISNFRKWRKVKVKINILWLVYIHVLRNLINSLGATVQEKFNHWVTSDQTTSAELLRELGSQLTRHSKLAKPAIYGYPH